MEAKRGVVVNSRACVQQRGAVVASDMLPLSVLLPPGSSAIWFMGFGPGFV